MSKKVETLGAPVNPTRFIEWVLEDCLVDLYAPYMTASLDKALVPLVDHIRAIDDYSTRYEAIEAAEERFKALKRALLQETALGLRAEGKKWKEVGAIMGGVSYQRAFQIAHGE